MLEQRPRHPSFLHCLLLISGNHFSLHRPTPRDHASVKVYNGSKGLNLLVFVFIPLRGRSFPSECCFFMLAGLLHIRQAIRSQFTRLFEGCFMHDERGERSKAVHALVRYHPLPHSPSCTCLESEIASDPPTLPIR